MKPTEHTAKYKAGETVCWKKGNMPVQYVGETAAGNHYIYLDFGKQTKSVKESELSPLPTEPEQPDSEAWEWENWKRNSVKEYLESAFFKYTKTEWQQSADEILNMFETHIRTLLANERERCAGIVEGLKKGDIELAGLQWEEVRPDIQYQYANTKGHNEALDKAIQAIRGKK